jgi:nucleoside-diphosphate-sugar epimerase
MTVGKICILGIGYAGAAVGRALAAEGWQIAGTSRLPEKRARQLPASWQIIGYQAGEASGLAELVSSCDALISTIAPLPDGRDPVITADSAVLAGFSGWTGYLSATSVYGAGTDWLDESSLPAPAEGRGKARLAAEQVWQKILPQTEMFRAAGIYGPGRNQLVRLRAGTARRISKPGHLFNRIYLDDLASIIAAAITRPRGGRIVNLADGQPCEQADLLAGLAEMAGLPIPDLVDFEAAGLTGMAASFWRHSRKIRSSVIEAELGVALSCPDWRAGYQRILAEEQS